MANKRKGLSKTMRFEVFKRDGFKCQYCGQSPPVIILEVDHIVPVASGGNDDQSNLLTSCLDCNRGKGCRGLEQVPISLKISIEEQKIRAKQVAAYNVFLMEIRSGELKTIEELGLYWNNQFRDEQNKFVFGVTRTASIRTFLKNLPQAQIFEAMDIAFERYFPRASGGVWDDDRTFRYFCGVCWNMIRGTERIPK